MSRMPGKAGAGSCVLAGVMVLAAWMPLRAPADIVINEVLADNGRIYMDDDGNYPDMVELFNYSVSAVDISGWKMTDDAKTNKFTFPAGTVLSPFNYLIVFCDNATNLAGLHTGFGLGKKGSYIGITNNALPPRGDSLTFGLQLTDYSIGRIPNGIGPFTLTSPTFGLPNVAALTATNLGVRINEWAATNSPPAGSTNSGLDWLELYNPSNYPVNIAGLVLTTLVPPTNSLLYGLKPIAKLSFIGANGFIKFDCVGNNAKANDEMNFKFSHNSGETNTMYLSTNAGALILDQIRFPGNNAVPGYWVPDCSYGRLPDGDTNRPYYYFRPGRPTPGTSNFQPLTNSLVVNEVLSHTDLPLEDAVEFYNPTPDPVDISGWWLSNAREDRLKFRIPSNTVVAPFGYKVFYEMIGSTNGFNTNGTGTNRCFTFNSAHGDTVVLTAVSNYTSGALTGFEVSKTFDSAKNGVSFGRYVTSDTNVEFVPMRQLSFGTSVTATSPPSQITLFRTGTGATNPYPLVGPLVISQIMYHPPDILQPVFTNGLWITNNIDDSTNEFIEVLNITSTNVPLYDPTPFGYYYDPNFPQYGVYADGSTNTWKIQGTVNFDFPTNVSLAPSNSLLVVNFNPTNAAQSNAFQQRYQVPAGVRLFGPYRNKLTNKGGSVELQMPDWPQGPAHPDFGYVPYVRVEDVQYNDKAPWPTNADGWGLSLRRVSPQGYGNDPTNWVESVPTPGPAQVVTLVSPRVQDGYFYLDLYTMAGMSYSLQGKDPAGATGWITLTSVDTCPTTGWRTLWTGPLMPSSSRYYRVVSPRQP